MSRTVGTCALNRVRRQRPQLRDEEWWSRLEFKQAMGAASYTGTPLGPDLWPDTNSGLGLFQLQADIRRAEWGLVVEFIGRNWAAGVERSVLERVLLNAESIADVARELGVSPNTARTWVARARERLQLAFGATVPRHATRLTG